MERAKEIKEKRALAKELGDWFSGSYQFHVVNRQKADVRSFEQAVVGQSSRSRSKGQSRVGDRKNEEGDEDTFSDEVPVKKDKVRPQVDARFEFLYLNVHSWSERGSEKHHGVLGRRQ